jgi:N-acyl-D-amino-acid deacylase
VIGSRRILHFANCKGGQDEGVSRRNIACCFVFPIAAGAIGPEHDTIIRSGLIYDGSGTASYTGDIAIDGERIAFVGRHARGHGRAEVDAHGEAVTPGFIIMLGHSEESLLVDGRALSDLVQGVTLEVFGEFSMGPLTPQMRTLLTERQADIRYDMEWSTLGEYLNKLQRRGISPNVASFVGAGTVRKDVLGEGDVQPSAEQLHAMEEGALGVTDMLGYAPEGFAKTEELIALAKESGRCGGIYTAHIRNEGDRSKRFKKPLPSLKHRALRLKFTTSSSRGWTIGPGTMRRSN